MNVDNFELLKIYEKKIIIININKKKLIIDK
jgi:hypothetical protein